jgi:tRNA G10  N-methylase Trm11
MLSIPPRLARIMINLTGRKGLLLDPFCGIGTILQEAALMGFDVYGTDIDKTVIPQAVQNLDWLSKEYKLSLQNLGEKIQTGDATKLSGLFQPESIDAIVTEPNLGPPLKIYPDQSKAESILRGLKPLYEKSLKEFSITLKPGSRICMVFPRFEFGEHFAGMEVRKLAEKAGLKPVNILEKYNIPGSFPYVDREPRHKTIREIWVLEKPAERKPMPMPPVDLAMEKA